MTSKTSSSSAYGDKAVIDEVATFVRVVRHGSFAAAARELGVPSPPSAGASIALKKLST